MANSSLESVVHPRSTAAAPTVLQHSAQTSREEQALGLRAIYAACRALYPDQPSPLQVTALRKFWMGGPDPLDFINMYANPGSVDGNSPPHWHYVTNGLSDLYGDSRLHSQCQRANEPSGFGFELTLRIRRSSGELSPPTWPAHLLQTIARYVFHSQAQLMPGDHIPWPSGLDEPPSVNIGQPYPASPTTITSVVPERSISTSTLPSVMLATNRGHHDSMAAGDAKQSLSSTNYTPIVPTGTISPTQSDSSMRPANSISRSSSYSRIRNMLLVEDSQLKRISTPYGYVQFLQLVGLFDEELRLVQRWSGSRVAEVMRTIHETGGDLLVTDMKRTRNVFQLKPDMVEYIREKLRREGSNLTGVTTQFFAWAPISFNSLSEVIPGELEAQHRRRSFSAKGYLPGQLSIPFNCAASSATRSQSPDSSEPLMQTIPTDLSVRPSFKSVPFTSGCDDGVVAMVTDETVVSNTSTTKEVMDQGEDEFIDVVGDDVSGTTSGRMEVSDSNPAGGLECTKPFEQCASAPAAFLSGWSSRPMGDDAAGHLQFVGNNSSPKNESKPSREPSSSPLTSLHMKTPLDGPLGFRTSVIGSSCYSPSFQQPNEFHGSATPGSAGSVPCTPLAHLSLSPGSLESMPAQVLDCLDLYICREAGEMLPLAVSDRLRHGRHFTFLNGHSPDHAVTLVPSGVSGSFVSEDTPYVARGPWLQILLPKDFLERLDFEFSSLLYPDDSAMSHLPLVFRWPERRLRICIIDLTTGSQSVPVSCLSPTSINRKAQTKTTSPCSSGYLGRPHACVPTPEAVMAALADAHRRHPLHQQQQCILADSFHRLAQAQSSRSSSCLASHWLQLFSSLMATKSASADEVGLNEMMARVMHAGGLHPSRPQC